MVIASNGSDQSEINNSGLYGMQTLGNAGDPCLHSRPIATRSIHPSPSSLQVSPICLQFEGLYDILGRIQRCASQRENGGRRINESVARDQIQQYRGELPR